VKSTSAVVIVVAVLIGAGALFYVLQRTRHRMMMQERIAVETVKIRAMEERLRERLARIQDFLDSDAPGKTDYARALRSSRGDETDEQFAAWIRENLKDLREAASAERDAVLEEMEALQKRVDELQRMRERAGRTVPLC
jgi:hypothetical protein